MKKASRESVRESVRLARHVAQELYDSLYKLETRERRGALAKDDIMSSAIALGRLIEEIKAVPADRLERIFEAKPRKPEEEEQE